MNQLLKDNYQAVINRGLITPKTTDEEFYNKLIEELDEVYQELPPFGSGSGCLNEDIADLMNVCSNWLIHRGEDPEVWLKIVLLKNQKRAKKF